MSFAVCTIIHRDLKTHNLLQDENGMIKITDFGEAKYLTKDEPKAFDIVGTLGYIAPEIEASLNGYDYKADVYSFGVVIWEIYTLKSPILNKAKVPNDCPKDLKNLIRKCLEENPTNRPSFNEIVDDLNKFIALMRE